ncbi:hypothetical protein WJX75_007567 [Coccomyxa subellipsoidea]|uniref:NAD(P)-binding protein n=1 Tax=Coccomyxa subellipsoidea TaxID=248742 RepID=A0ABR2Z239_9CHLO
MDGPVRRRHPATDTARSVFQESSEHSEVGTFGSRHFTGSDRGSVELLPQCIRSSHHAQGWKKGFGIRPMMDAVLSMPSRNQTKLGGNCCETCCFSETAPKDSDKALLVVASNVTVFRRSKSRSGTKIAAKPAKLLQESKKEATRSRQLSDKAPLEKLEKVLTSPRKALPFLSEAADRATHGLHKPIGLVLTSAYVLGTACQLSGVSMGGTWGPAAMGAVLGSLYAALNRFGMKRFWRTPHAPLNVVVTGGTKGIGKAIAREFLRSGDRVMVSSRSVQAVRRAMNELREEVGTDIWIGGIDCDVSSPASVQRLADGAASQMGSIDVWINNAGYSGSFQSFIDARPDQIQEVVQTNLLGCLLCTRAAMRLMAAQPRGGHIFNMDGAGADGLPTPQYAAYGATKAGIAHLMGSLTSEGASGAARVGVHCLSPGMVLTNLLLEGASDINKQIFNILCEQPETVAAFLVPRARTVAARGEAGRYIRFLTLPRALLRFITAPLRANRFFNADGEAVYARERDRILGQRAKRTERLAAAAARRSRNLAFAYSASVATAYAIIAADTLARVKP